MESLLLHIKHGAITNGAALKKFVDFLKQKDGTIELKAKRAKKRSLNQNNYLHVIFTMLVEPLRQAGWNNIRNMDDAKEFIKGLFLTIKITNEKTGETIKKVRGTSELSVEEMQIFIEDIKQWATEYLSFYVPDANEQMSAFNCM